MKKVIIAVVVLMLTGLQSFSQFKVDGKEETTSKLPTGLSVKDKEFVLDAGYTIVKSKDKTISTIINTKSKKVLGSFGCNPCVGGTCLIDRRDWISCSGCCTFYVTTSNVNYAESADAAKNIVWKRFIQKN